MIRVVVDGIVYLRNPQGGIARYWTEVMKALTHAEPSLRLNLVVPPRAQRPAGIPSHANGSLPAYWVAFRADVFHSTYYTCWPRLKCPSVATGYDFVDATFPEFNPNGPGFVERQLDVLRRASAVIAISQATRDLVVEIAGIDPARIFVAYPSVPAPFALPLPAEREIREFRCVTTGGAPYLLHVGDRRNYKNFRTILKAFCLAANSTDRHLLVFGGRQTLSEEEADLIIAAKALDRIHYRSRVDDAALRLAYAGADAMVHASLMEGFGIPVIEALACGTGLILSDIPVYREIADGKAVFVEAGDVDAWSQAMKAPVPVQAAWREETLRRFTWEEAARIHIQTYESVVG